MFFAKTCTLASNAQDQTHLLAQACKVFSTTNPVPAAYSHHLSSSPNTTILPCGLTGIVAARIFVLPAQAHCVNVAQSTSIHLRRRSERNSGTVPTLALCAGALRPPQGQTAEDHYLGQRGEAGEEDLTVGGATAPAQRERGAREGGCACAVALPDRAGPSLTAAPSSISLRAPLEAESR